MGPMEGPRPATAAIEAEKPIVFLLDQSARGAYRTGE